MKRDIVTPQPFRFFFLKHPAWIHRPRTVFLLAGNFSLQNTPALKFSNFIIKKKEKKKERKKEEKKKYFLTLKTVRN